MGKTRIDSLFLKAFIKDGILSFGSLLFKNDKSKVIYYHDIHDRKKYTDMSTPIELFKKHINILYECGYKPVSEIKNSKKEVEITFDDGFRGIYENFSFFVDNKIPVQIFLISGSIGEKEYLEKTQIEQMLETGLLTVGSHTVSHNNLDNMDEITAVKELKESKKALEDMFGREIKTLCFPRGKFSDRTIRLAFELGYEKLYSCLPGNYHDPFKKGLVNRSLVQHADEAEFKKILQGADKIFFNRYLKQQYRPGET